MKTLIFCYIVVLFYFCCLGKAASNGDKIAKRILDEGEDQNGR